MQKIDMLNTKKMKRIFLFGLLALLVVSCSSNSDEPEPAPDDDVTIIYPKDTSEHELTDFRCQLVSDESGSQWEIKFEREQENPFMGGGDEEGVSIVVTNMKDEWKALKDETVVVSGKYRALHTKYCHRNQATISYSYTANAGFYCTADGRQGSWNNGDPIWMEYDKDNFVLTYGHYPGKTTAGTKYVVKPVLVYTKGGKEYKAVITLNMQFCPCFLG